MSLGLRLRAKLAFPSLEPEPFIQLVEQWIHHKYGQMSPRTRRGFMDEFPTLFCHLHPAAEEIELSLISPQHLVASANTSTVGPGYHAFLTSFLKEWAQEFHATWEPADESSIDYGDDTGYFFSADEERLCREMTAWLRALAGSFFEGSIPADAPGVALCMPMDVQFESEHMAITPLGPRDRDWLYEIAHGADVGSNFFAWRKIGFNADYHLGRALAHMWSNVRWRPPVGESERNVLRDVSESLRSSYRLDPTLHYPWAEWKQILEFLDADREEIGLVNAHVSEPSAIGYRRRSVRVILPGGWRMRIPGSFSEFEAGQEGDYYAIDPPREIWFTSFRFSADSPSATFESGRQQIKADFTDHLLEGDDFVAGAKIQQKQRDSGEKYYVLSSSNIAPSQRAVCTILFSEPEQEKWALDTWRSIQAPPELDSSS
ncbi:MAG TPA: hypothetical protein VMI93_10615 [Candidatus Solibacter sp.]|nr:hypothetical protein [Candidatus Solibacter sp.]